MDNIDLMKELVSMAVRKRGYRLCSVAVHYGGDIVQAFSVESIPGTMGHPACVAELRADEDGNFIFSVDENDVRDRERI